MKYEEKREEICGGGFLFLWGRIRVSKGGG